MKQCVIYARVSTSDQDYTSQIKDLEAYAEYKDYEVVEVFGEKVSGYDITKERLEYDRMKRFVVDNDIKEILIWELSRFSRNTRKSLEEIEFFKEKGVNIYFEKEKINTLGEDANSKLLTTILSAFAELERETIVQRSQRGRDQTAKEGRRVGMPTIPYGIDVDEKGYLIEHEEEAKNVRKMYEWFLRGYSYERIAKELSLRNIPTKKGKKKWLPTAVRSILRNEINIGKRKYREYVFDLSFQIVDTKTFKKAQENIKLKINNYHSLKRHNVSNKETHHFKGKVRCGKCGRGMGSISDVPKHPNDIMELEGRKKLYYRKEALGNYYYAYRCNGAGGTAIHRNTQCDAGQIKASVLDIAVHQILQGSQAYVNDLLGRAKKDFNVTEKRAILTNTKNDLAKVKARKKAAKDIYSDDADQVGYSRRMAKISQDEAVLMKRKSELEQAINNFYVFTNSSVTKKYNLKPGKTWNQGGRWGTRDEDIERLVEKIVVYKVKSWSLKWEELPKRFYKTVVGYTSNEEDQSTKVAPPEIITQEAGFNKTPVGSSDKVVYLELYFFGIDQPVKAVVTPITDNFHTGDDLNYDKKKQHLTIQTP